MIPMVPSWEFQLPQWDLWNNFCDHSCSLWDGLVQDSWVHHSRMYFRSMVRNVNFLWESKRMNYLQGCCSVSQSCPALREPMGWEVSFVGLRLLFAGKQIIYLFRMIFNYLWWHYTCTHSVAKLCPTLFDPVDCSLPGSTDSRISQARILEWVAICFSRGIFLTQGWNSCLLCLLHCRRILSPLSHQKGWPYVCKY